MSICHDYCRCAAITVAVAATALKLETQAYRGLGRGGIAHALSTAVVELILREKIRVQQMVLIGHSQGGLLMKMSVIDPGTRLWETMFSVPPEKLDVDGDLREGLTRELERKGLLIFEPLPFVRRVVFVATPHRGSYRALGVLGDLASWLVNLPGRVARMSVALATLGARGLLREPTRASRLQSRT
jgi:hypothetical protein